MKVLIIEDESGIAVFIKKGLEAELFVVDTALTGQQGIVLAGQNQYDAIILDFYLPDMLGSDISIAIHQFKPSIPILVLSVEGSMDIKVDMLSICDDYMIKPFYYRTRQSVKLLHLRGRASQESHFSIWFTCQRYTRSR